MKKYEEYKDSEIRWLGEIPEHWELRRIKDISNKVGSGITPKGGSEVYSDHGIMFFRSQNIQNNKLDYKDIAYISNKIDKKMSSTRIRYKDLLLNITGASIGRCFYVSSNIKGNVNQHVCIIRPKQRTVDTRFLHYSIISPYGQDLIMFCQNGANREGLSFQLINNFQFLIPSIEEQIIIANYLDSKTQFIDKKIELLNKKMQKYRELRKTIINKAVCRGLNSNVKFIESGIEWIGKIPEHWGVYRLKDIGFLYSGLSGKSGDDFYRENHQNNKQFIPYTNIFNNISVDKENMGTVVVHEREKQNKVKANDIFFLMSSEDYDGLGKSSILKNDLKNTYLNSFCKGFRVKKKNFYSDFINYQLSADSFRKLLQIEGKGFTRMNLKTEKVNEFKVFIPQTIKEQKDIVSYINLKSEKIYNIIGVIQQQIVKLQELRRTLINDVVTGTIKVTE